MNNAIFKPGDRVVYKGIFYTVKSISAITMVGSVRFYKYALHGTDDEVWEDALIAFKYHNDTFFGSAADGASDFSKMYYRERIDPSKYFKEGKPSIPAIMKIVIKQQGVMNAAPNGANGLFHVQIFQDGKQINGSEKRELYQSINVVCSDIVYKVGKQYVYMIHGVPQKVWTHFGEFLNYFRNQYGLDVYCEFLEPYKISVK